MAPSLPVSSGPVSGPAGRQVPGSGVQFGVESAGEHVISIKTARTKEESFILLSICASLELLGSLSEG